MRAFLVGLGIGTLICVLALTMTVRALNDVPGAGSSGELASSKYKVTVKIKLSNDGIGTQKEVAAGFALEDEFTDYFDDHSETGQLDGDGVGFGYFDLYLYTADRDRLITDILPIVRASDPPSGSYISSKDTNTGADEQRIDL